MSQQNQSPALSLVCVWLVDLINERGWCVSRYSGPDRIMNQGHDVRDVLRAELQPNGVDLILELCGFVGATGTKHTLSLPFIGPSGKDSVCVYFTFKKIERIAVWWTEIDQSTSMAISCKVELSRTKP